MTQSGSETIAPLAGLKVLDFTVLLPGPFATYILGDLGATVLRVEAPARPDLLRSMPYTHATLNRGKRSLALDLKQPESITTVKGLLDEYDIVIEGFRPGVMQRLSLDYETLRTVRPDLIYCSISGFGQTGPFRDRPGHDIGYLALAGAASYSGDSERGPALPGVQVADLASSMNAVAGILAAVIHRQRTGEGQYVDISITDAAFALNVLQSPAVLAGEPAAKPQETELNGGALYDFYRTKDGFWMAMGALEPPFVRALFHCLGLDDAEVPAPFARDDVRALKQRVVAAFATRDYTEWLQVFAASEACVDPVLNLAEAAQHPQLIARQMVIEVPGPNGTTQRQPACSIKFSRPLPHPRFAGVELGAHTVEVLAGLATGAASAAAGVAGLVSPANGSTDG